MPIEHCPYLEQALRDELNRNSQRWTKTYKLMPDPKRRDVLGKMCARRLVSECHQKAANESFEPDEIRKANREILETMGPLGYDSGGGRRVVRGTKSMS